MKKILKMLVLFAAMILLLAPFDATAKKTKQKKAPVAENVIFIGSDGFGAFIVRDNPGVFPNIEKLAARGSSTLEMRSVLPSSSAVNWASHLMGAGPELHGYTEWGSKTPDLPSRVVTVSGMFPDIFGLVRAGYPDGEMGVFYPWGGIGYLFDTTAVNVNALVPDDSAMTARAVDYVLGRKPKFAFFYFAEPDGVGHGKGWESPEYFEMCKQIDTYTGQILDAIEQAGMRDNTVVIFTSDHGGTGKGHGGKSMQEMQVPWIIAGPGIKKGYTVPESMMVFDDAATIARIFGIQQPQVWIGRAPESIFE